MTTKQTQAEPFFIKDCALIAIATGKRAQNLRELVNHIQIITSDSLYYHFWGGLLRPRFDDPEYHNDFAIWARHALHDKILAERLSLIDPTIYSNLEDLRQELVEIIEERLDDVDYPLWAKHDLQFEFIRSQIVIFNTQIEAIHPKDFVKMLPQISVGSVFYHFVDAKRRNDQGLDDFQNWIKDLNGDFNILCENISQIDPYYSTLAELRSKLTLVFTGFFKKGK